jgi:DNA-directed RNA polymerase specialized sigma24 family protein
MRLLQRDHLLGIVQMSSPDHQAAYLSTTLSWQLKNRRRDQHRLCRGGGLSFVSLSDDEHSSIEPSHQHNPELQLSIAWVNERLDKAYACLRSELKPETWPCVESALLGEDAPSDAPQSGAIRVAVHRARRRLRVILANDVPGAADLREAAAQLLGALTALSPV